MGYRVRIELKQRSFRQPSTAPTCTARPTLLTRLPTKYASSPRNTSANSYLIDSKKHQPAAAPRYRKAAVRLTCHPAGIPAIKRKSKVCKMLPAGEHQVLELRTSLPCGCIAL